MTDTVLEVNPEQPEGVVAGVTVVVETPVQAEASQTSVEEVREGEGVREGGKE